MKLTSLCNKKKKNKKAVSLIVAYVLLITIAVSLSAIVYTWLRGYVSPVKEVSCPEGTSIIIKDYDYNCTADTLNITLQNKGLFTTKGFIIRVNDRVGAEIGVHKLDEQDLELKPGNETNQKYSITQNKLTFVEVQAYIYDNSDKVFCEKVAAQILQCREN